MLRRRELLVGAAASAAALAMGFAPGSAAPPATAKKLKLLVLGGTLFVGPAIVEAALARGHEVTTFNRGKTNPDLFPGIEKIRGDRDPRSLSLVGLENQRQWDAVIDVWPWDPHMVALTAQLLRDRVGRYAYVSTVGAYRDVVRPGVTEDAPLFDDFSNGRAWYEYSKAQCERVLQKLVPEKLLVVRPHAIAGYRKNDSDFAFWPVRIFRGGDVLAPGDGLDPVQYIDVKDIADFLVSAVERELTGAFTLAGPAASVTTMKGWLDGLNASFGSKANLIWASEEYLIGSGIRFMRGDLPMWLPRRRARSPGFMQVSNAKAVAAGLTFRPIGSTGADEVRWFAENHIANPQADVPFGLSRARELELLREWARRTN